MSRNRRQTGAVRGPASALTSFLANLGVEPSTRLTTWGNTNALNPDGSSTDQTALAPDGPIITDDNSLDPAGAVTAAVVVAGPSQAGESAPGPEDFTDIEPTKKARKRARAASVNSDDLDAEAGPSAGTSRHISPVPGPSAAKASPNVEPTQLRAVGEFMDCGECAKRFTVTAYTKEHPNRPSTWLCLNCCYALNIDPFAKPKKAAKKAVARKEDRAKIVHYEERKGVTQLGDLCIQLIGKYIEDIDQLGDIGGVNMDKVCKIISKGRRLTPATASLFFSADRTHLAMFDCTGLAEESYLALANLCPKLETLHLHLCGQLTTDALTAWGAKLSHLKRLELFAPFLVRKQGWINFFQSVGHRLEGLLITQSPRIDVETVNILVDYCPNLTELRLSEFGLLGDHFLEPISRLKQLAILDLSSPGTPLTDDGVIALLAAVGDKIVSLNLSDNPDLTDAILPSIAACSGLRELRLRNVVELTDEGVADFFQLMCNNGHPGLEIIDLEKGHELKDMALQTLVTHSAGTLEKLSLLGWREVGSDALSHLTKCKRLRELDLGWCRQVTDFTVKDVLQSCDALRLVKVWGCNQLTDAVPRKKGVKVIGIETHSI